MSIIQLLFTGSGVFTKTNFWATTAAKPRVTVMEDSLGSLFTIDTVRTRSILVEMWGGGGASGSTRYGTSGYGGSGGYISGRIPTSALSSNILRLVVGGGGGATGGGDLNPAGSNDYYARPIAPPTPGQFAEFNVSTIQHVASTSTSSNPTFSTITPVTGSTVSSSNSVTYSTISPVPGATVSSVSSATYSTITPLGSVTGANTTTLDLTTLPGGALQAGDIVLVASSCVDGTVNPPTIGGYIPIRTGNASVSYSLSYKIMGATPDASVSGLQDIITVGGNDLQVAHIASVFRGVSLDTAIIASNAVQTINNPDPPSVTPDISGCTSIAFGFVPTRAYTATDIPNASLPANYGNLTIQAATGAAAADESTVMNAYRSNIPVALEDPGIFNIPQNETCIAITVLLRPQQTLSPITGSMTLSGLADGDIILVSSVSDGGTMNTPTNTGFGVISSSTGTSPAYKVSWKKVTAAELVGTSYTITGLSLSGTIDTGPAAGDPAGVAHYATAFRGVDPTLITPIITTIPSASTGTGDPDSPSVSPTTANHTIVSFGFLADRSLPTVSPPTNYTLLPNGVLTTGNDATGTTQATSMVAYRSLGAILDGNPDPFTVSGSAGADYAAVTVGLIPSRTLSAISGSMTIPAGVVQAGDVVLVSSVSDGPDPITGTMNLPSALGGSFLNISNSTGSPSYRVSWKRLSATDFDLTGAVPISGLSLSGTTGGLAAGVAHHATAFRGVDTTAATPFLAATATPGTGNPDPPAAAVSLPISNYTAVAFGFLNNTALPTVSPPTGYNQLSTLTVSDSTPGAEATSMVAYRASLGSGTADVNPGAFSVTGVGGQNNAAVTVALRPSPVAIGGDFSTLTLPAVQPNDLIIVASVSDGGLLATPAGYTPLVPSQTGSDSPSYQISYKRTDGTDTQVTGLSPNGALDGGDPGTAGVAHVASVYRGVSLTTNPAGIVANGTGNPDPPQINGVSSGDGVVVFGFLDNRSILDANITSPTTPVPGYAKTITRAVGSDNNGNDEATLMSAFKLLTASGNENPGAFSVTGNGGEQNSAISIRLVPQVNARFSTATGACGGSGGGYSGIFLSTGTPLLIAGGGGGGGGATTYPFVAAFGGNGGSGASFPGGNGNISVLDTAFLPSIVYRSLGTGGGGGTIFGGGTGGITLAGGTATPIIGNAGEAGQIYNSPSVPLVDGFYSGGRGANSPYNDLTSLPLQGANATGGWNRGAGGGSSRTDSFTTPVPAPTDCGGGGGGGYYGGGGGGSGDGGGGGGGGGGSNYADPLVSVLVSAGGDSLTPGIPAATLSPNYIPGVAVGGAPVVGAGVDVPGNPGGNGLIILTYFA